MNKGCPITCSAPGCSRTRESHPLNFRLRKKTKDPLCQGHYIQTKKATFTGEFHKIRDSGKEGTKYNKRNPTKSHSCKYCDQGFNSLQGLHYHHTYRSVKKLSPCNKAHKHNSDTIAAAKILCSL